MSDLAIVGIGLVGVVLALIQICRYGFDFDALFLEEDDFTFEDFLESDIEIRYGGQVVGVVKGRDFAKEDK